MALALVYTINLNTACTPGVYVDGMIKYDPGCKVICGVATPHIASEYGPDVARCAPRVRREVIRKSVTLIAVDPSGETSCSRILPVYGILAL